MNQGSDWTDLSHLESMLGNVVVLGKAWGAHDWVLQMPIFLGGALAGQDGYGSQSIPTHPCEWGDQSLWRLQYHRRLQPSMRRQRLLLVLVQEWLVRLYSWRSKLLGQSLLTRLSILCREVLQSRLARSTLCRFKFVPLQLRLVWDVVHMHPFLMPVVLQPAGVDTWRVYCPLTPSALAVQQKRRLLITNLVSFECVAASGC